MSLRLSVVLDADASGLTGEVKVSREELDKLGKGFGDGAKRANEFDKSIEGVRSRVDTLKAALAAIGIEEFVRHTVTVQARAEEMSAQMETWAGSADKAATVVAMLNRVNKDTGANLPELERAWLSLRTNGIQPTSAMLVNFADLAASRGKQLTDVTQTISDATLGNFKGLKDLGITAVDQVDRVRLTFQDTSVVVAKTNASIAQGLAAFGQDFSGKAIAQSQRLTGVLEDTTAAVERLFLQVGEGGVGEGVKAFQKAIQEITEGSDNLARALGATLGKSIKAAADALKFLNENANVVKATLAGLGVGYAAYQIAELGEAVLKTAETFKKATSAFDALAKITKTNPWILAITAAAAAIGGLYVAYHQLTPEQIEVAKLIDEEARKLDEHTAKLDKNTAAIQLNAQAKRQDQIDAAQKEIDDLERQLLKNLDTAGLRPLDKANSAGVFGDDAATAGQLALDLFAKATQKNSTEMVELQRRLEAAHIVLERLKQGFNETAPAADKAGNSIGHFGGQLSELLTPLQKLKRDNDALEESLKALLDGGLDTYQQTVAQQKLEIEARDRATASYRDYIQQYKDGTKTFQDFYDEEVRGLTLEEALAIAHDQAAQNWQVANQAISAGLPPLIKYQQTQAQLRTLIPTIAQALVVQANAHGLVLDKTVALAQAQQIVNKLLEDAQVEYDEMTVRASAALTKAAEQFQELANEIQYGFKNAFEQAFDGTVPLWKGMLDEMGSILKHQLAEWAYMALIQPIVVPVLQQIGTGTFGLPSTTVNKSLGLDPNTPIGNVGNLLSLSNLVKGSSTLANLGNSIALSGAGEWLGLSSQLNLAGAASNSVTLAELTAGRSLTGAGSALSSGLQYSPWGAVGSLAASLVGFKGTGNMLADVALQGAGSIGGAALGAQFGAIGGPIGAAIGAFAMAAISSLFASKPSNKTQGANINIDTGDVQKGGLTGNRYSAENAAGADQFSQFVLKMIDGLKQVTGGQVKLPGGGNNVLVEVGDRDGINVQIGPAGGHFSSMEEAVKFAADTIANSLTGVAPEVETAIKNIDWGGDMEAAFNKLEFAANFRATIEALNNGSTDVAKAVQANAAGAVKDALGFIRQFKKDTADLGLDTQKASDATKHYVEQLLGIADVAGPESQLQIALETLEGTFAAAGDLLEEVGYSASDTVALLAAAKARAVGAANAGLIQETWNAEGKGYLNQLLDVTNRNTTLRKDIPNGLDASLIDRIQAGSAKSVVAQALSGAKTFEEAQAIVTEINNTFSEFPGIVSAANQALLEFQTGMQGIATKESLFREMWDAEGKGYIGSLLDVTNRDAGLRKNVPAGVDVSVIDRIQAGSAKSIIAQALSGAKTFSEAQVIITEIKNTFSGFPAIVAAANQGLIDFQTGLASNTNVVSLFGDAVKAQTDALQTKVGDLTDTFNTMDKAAKAYARAALQLDLDPRTSTLNPMGQLLLAQSQYDQLRARAFGGDQEAIDQLQDMGGTLVELARQVYGSNSQFVAIQTQVKSDFNQIAVFAGAQRDVAHQQLDVAQAQLLELKRIGAIGSAAGSGAPRPSTQADFDQVNALWNQVNAGKPAGSADPATIAVFEKTLGGLYGTSNDTSFLQQQLSYQQGRTGDAVFGSSAGNLADTIEGRLRQLGVPGYARGGDHPGGYFLAGEEGVELGAVGPARFFTAQQTMGIFGGAGGSGDAVVQRLERSIALQQKQVDIGMGHLFEASQLNDRVVSLENAQARLGRSVQDLADRLPRTGTYGGR